MYLGYKEGIFFSFLLYYFFSGPHTQHETQFWVQHGAGTHDLKIKRPELRLRVDVWPTEPHNHSTKEGIVKLISIYQYSFFFLFVFNVRAMAKSFYINAISLGWDGWMERGKGKENWWGVEWGGRGN